MPRPPAALPNHPLAVFGRILVLLGLTLAAGCSRQNDPAVLDFWALGREGEAVQALLPEFERRHPGLRVEVQQIPWSAAHEKLLTAYAGDALPDLFQLGNTWIPEFVALKAIEPLDDRFPTAGFEDVFPGILESTRVEGRLYGLPWYVDTRLFFYRRDLLAAAGFAEPPRTWAAWQEAMARIKALPGAPWPLFLPLNEWQVPVILGLQQGAAPLRDGGRFGNFRSAGFRRAFATYLDWFRRGYAPLGAEAQMANLYQEFARDRYALLVTGPWNLGEFRHRLPAAMQKLWATAPLPAADPEPGHPADYPGISLAGGASLVLSRAARKPADALALMAYLGEPAQQAAFHRLTGDLPARRSSWDAPELAGDGPVRAFRLQLERVAATPAIPEWERIADKLAHYAERAVRGELPEDAALTALDADVDRILEKRRWLLDREGRASGSAPAAPARGATPNDTGGRP